MEPLLEVKDLSVTFHSRGQKVYAVRDVSFNVDPGESIGIVGESGSGKSATIQAITQLTDAEIKGQVLFKGKKSIQLGTEVGIVFQDPSSSLNPTMKIGAQITEGLIYHKIAKKKDAKEKAIKLLEWMGISDPKIRYDQYPHQFSGGMRQRVILAIAIACNPNLLIADEPTTALDDETKEQILNLLLKMKKELNLSLLVISHDISVMEKMADRILVMYAGKIVEEGTKEKILKEPKHPYTKLLIGSTIQKNQRKTIPLKTIVGLPPNLLFIPKGCAFKERCPYRALKCEIEPKGEVACWRT